MANTYGTCKLCGQEGAPISIKTDTWTECPICGTWGSTNHLYDVIPEGLKPGLRIAVRQASDRKDEPIFFTSQTIASIHAPFANVSLDQKRMSILAVVRHGSEGEFGRIVPVAYVNTYPACWCKSAGEMQLITQLLDETGYLKRVSDNQYSLTAKGWDATNIGHGGSIPGTCFVAMRFGDAALDVAYEYGIVRAAEDPVVGLNVIRVDRQQSNDKIDDRIIDGLRRAEVTVAEVTDPNAGAYFEAGFALALGRQVIFCCRDDAFADGKGVHFDTRMYPYIRWTDAEDLRQKLILRLLNTVPSLVAKRKGP